jgi:hypothetical protein
VRALCCCQRCLQHLPIRDRSFVIDSIHAQCLVVARHRHGCCVLQRCLDAATEEQREALTADIIDHALLLMQDPFGNYVIQYVLQKGTWEHARELMCRIPGHMVSLSTQKFSSNVVEKCLQMADEEMKWVWRFFRGGVAPNGLLEVGFSPSVSCACCLWRVRDAVLSEICSEEAMMRLLHDQFGNYVVQRALTVANVEMGSRLVAAIRPHLPSLANSSGGRRITAVRLISCFLCHCGRCC